MTPEERADLNRNLYAIEAQMLAVRHQVDAATVASSIKEHYPTASTVSFYMESDHGDKYIKDVQMLDANGQAVPAAPEWEKEPSSMVSVTASVGSSRSHLGGRVNLYWLRSTQVL